MNMNRTENGSGVIGTLLFIPVMLIVMILFASVLGNVREQRDKELYDQIKNDKQTIITEDEDNENYRR